MQKHSKRLIMILLHKHSVSLLDLLAVLFAWAPAPAGLVPVIKLNKRHWEKYRRWKKYDGDTLEDTPDYVWKIQGSIIATWMAGFNTKYQ